ncbi:MAG: SDR family oxidoreductase [Chloroflexi bacterium]|nr:SDR family oxidoreductase [Chloroflexota bacterium]
MDPGADWPGLAGRVAIVTGGSRNMGRGFALGLAGAGVAVGLLDLPSQDSAAAEVLAQIKGHGGRALFVPADVRDSAAVADAVAQVESELGVVSILVNNAARMEDDEASCLDYPPDLLDANHAVTVRGTFAVSQAVARRLADAGQPGSIVNIASRVGQQVQTGSFGYSIAKSAVIHMTRLMAVDLGPHGIRVNAIGPGPIPRPESGGAVVDADRFILPRALAYGDIVGTALYLASDASAMVTGQLIIVDGGLGLRPAY